MAPEGLWALKRVGPANTMRDLAAFSVTTYDAASRMLSMPGGFIETRVYNAMGQLTSLTNNSVSMAYTATPLGRTTGNSPGKPPSGRARAAALR